MSQSTVKKEVDITICDFCDEEVDRRKEYCRYEMPSSGWIIEPRTAFDRITHFVFMWTKPKVQKFVRYDFHASCFDQLMRKFLAEKGKI
jgi:hypothetical protein